MYAITVIVSKSVSASVMVVFIKVTEKVVYGYVVNVVSMIGSKILLVYDLERAWLSFSELRHNSDYGVAYVEEQLMTFVKI